MRRRGVVLKLFAVTSILIAIVFGSAMLAESLFFERFYRAPGARQFAGGTGLGLSIVKTIAADHNGHAWADGEPEYGTSFYLSLPVVRECLQ